MEKERRREEILGRIMEEIVGMVKGLLERLMLEERRMYLDSHPTKGNGYYTRDLLTLYGPVRDLRVPRVREGDFRPVILPERRRISYELSEAILAMYASGLSTRDIARVLETLYGAFYSPQSISRLTKVVEAEVQAFRERLLSAEYYAIYLDCTFLAIRRGTTAKEPVYLALGILPDGRREVLGFWLFGAEGESARNWEVVLKDLQRRGVERVRIFVTDDLPGLGEAIRRLYPQADRQLCVLHAVRESLAQVRRKDREAVAEDLKAIYRAEGLEEAEEAIRRLQSRWGKVYPRVVEKWERKAQELLVFLRHPREIRRYLYTTNQLERLTKEVKRRTKVVEVFCGEEAVEKLLYLVLSEVNERLRNRRLRGFAEIASGGYHVPRHNS